MSENFTTWTESDSPGRLSQSASRSTFTNLNRTDANVWLRKDKAGLLQNFNILFDFRITSLTSSITTIRAMLLNIATVLDGWRPNWLANQTQMGIQILSSLANKYYLLLDETYAGTHYTDSSGSTNDLSTGITYYASMTKIGTTLTLKIYSDAARTALVPGYDLSLVLHADHDLTYLMCPDTVEFTSTSLSISGYVENMSFVIDTTPRDLKGIFNTIRSLDLDLQAEFRVAQDVEDLVAEFLLRQENLDLFGVFKIIRGAQSSLFAEFATSTINATPIDSWGVLRVNQKYDLTRAKGIGFYWWGTGGWDQLVEFEMYTPTGFFRAYFADGPANWHYIFIPMSRFEQLGIDGSLPDITDITAFLWTYHSNGLRRVVDLAIWYVLPPDLKIIFTVRQSTTLELVTEFKVSHVGAPQQLKAEFLLRQETTDLKTEFALKQYNGEANLSCEFRVGDLIDIYEVTGVTSGPTIGATYGLVEEMTRTLTLAVGDKVIIDFEGDSYFALNYIDAVIRADGVNISPEIRSGDYYSAGSSTYSRVNVTRKAKYIAISDGDVVFTVVAKRGGSGPIWVGTSRHMILTHIH